MAKLPYEVLKRKSKRTKKDGTVVEDESHFYYIRFRLNGKLTYINLYTDNEKKAYAAAPAAYVEATKDAPVPYSKYSLRSYIIDNHWTDPLLNPRYKEFKNNISNQPFRYQNSLRVSQMLSFVFIEKEKELGEELGRVNYTSVSKSDVKKFKERLLEYRDEKTGKPLNAYYINRTLTALFDVYEYIIKNEENDIVANPFSKDITSRVKEPEYKQKFVFEPKEMKRLLDYDLLKMCKGICVSLYENKPSQREYKDKWWHNFLNTPYYKALCIMALTGMRFNEVSALRKSSFKKDGHVVEIDTAFKVIIYGNLMKNYLDGSEDIEIFGPPKNGHTRNIVLCDKAYYIIKPLLDDCEEDSDLVFVMKRGEGKYRNLFPIYNNNVKQYMAIFLKGFCQKFNIKPNEKERISPHCLRTSLNTNLLKPDGPAYGLKESWIADYMGWKTKTLTATQSTNYTQLGLEAAWEVAAAINKLYTGKEMMWKLLNLTKREYNIETAEAEIRGQKEQLKFLKLKTMILEIHLELASFEGLGRYGHLVRNDFRRFIIKTRDFDSKFTFNDLRDLLISGEEFVRYGLRTCEEFFPKEAEKLKLKFDELYKTAYIK